MSSLTLWKRRLRPSFLAGEMTRISRKIRRRIERPELKVAHLEPLGERHGRALVSYIIDGLLVAPDTDLPRSHTHFWESRQIARTFADLGYETDVIHWSNTVFEPQERYDVLVDARINLERLAPSVGGECVKIQHIETAHHLFHNAAQLERLEALEARRGVRLRPQRLIEENRAIETADCGIAVGNEFTIGTYRHAGKPVHRVPISVPCQYPSPAGKDFDACRNGFVWFGSGGLVHKGLDLVLEAFVGLPQHRLTVCGPIHMERDFEAAFAHELYETSNIHTAGWVDVSGERFREICRRSLGVVYPSCSEGGGGSVITCLHAGLIPVVTPETSVDLDGFGVELEAASIEAIRDAVTRLSDRPAESLREDAVAGWSHVRAHHTRESFARDYRRVVADILSGTGREVDPGD